MEALSEEWSMLVKSPARRDDDPEESLETEREGPVSDADSLSVAFLYNRLNRSSYLALAGALEVLPELRRVPVEWLPGGAALTEALDTLLDRYSRIVVCCSFMTSQLPSVRRDLSALVRHPQRRRLFLLAGGPHASGDPRKCLKEGFDGVCAGEGEGPFARLVLAMLRKGDITRVPGFYLGNSHRVVHTGRDVAADWELFPALPYRLGKYGAIEITRGCPFGCRYCQTHVLKGRRVRHRRPEAIFRAVEYLVEGGRTDIRFITPNALAYGSPDGRVLNLGAVSSLLEGIRRRLPPRGRIFFGSFPSEVRPEFVNGESCDLIRDLCDNRMVVFGAQSGNPRMLEVMRRGHSVEDVRKACRVLIERDFESVVDFIVGLPGESIDEMNESAAFMEELGEMGVRLHVHAFMPLPGSPWAALAPTPIPHAVRRRMERLIAKGRLFGQWAQQEKLVSEEYFL